MVWIPNVEYILAVFKDQIERPDLINRQGIISTLDKVRWGIPYQEAPSIWDQVAILYKDLIEFHSFKDDNKRIGSLIAYLFLKNNDYLFNPPEGELHSITMEVA